MATHPVDSTVLDVARLVPTGGIVVAVTDDGRDPRHAAIRDVATEIAVAAGGKVVLYHAPAGQAAPGSVRSRLFVPVVGGRDGVTMRAHTGTRRRDLLSMEAAAIRSRGVDVAVWLSGRSGLAGMTEAVALTHAAIILLPAEPERPGIVRRTLEYYAARIAAPVVAVDPAGLLTRIRPLGGHRPAEGPGSAPVPGAVFVAGAAAAGFVR